MEFWPASTDFHHGSHSFEYDISSTSSTSPTLSEFEVFPPIYQSNFSPIPDDLGFNYSMPLTPSDFGSPEDSPLYSPRESIALPVSHTGQPAERTHATSGRRRAQNRAAQRAFRERKEKHAKDLEQKLSELTVKYQSLETSHSELTAAYEKLHKTLEILTQKEEAEGGSRSAETLRKFLTILHGEIRIKADRESVPADV